MKAKGDVTESTDAHLVGRVLEGDVHAFGELVLKYEDSLYNFCYRLSGRREETEDLAQETFIRAYRNLSRFDRTKKFSTWLFAIANNLAIDRWRARDPDALSIDEIPPSIEPASSLGDPERETIGRELGENLEAALGKLPINYRTAIVLRHIEGLSYLELSEALGVAEGTIKTWLHRGRELLKREMRAVMGDAL
ncbi:MAG: sigma-70 family RNA polymerase sigma factor [Actinobacteria bacterium]|nr:sigma-70 family RNA polymerase sigma factor [Actinomycetota bacterium]